MSLLKKIGGAIGGLARAIGPAASVIPGAGAVVGIAGMLGQRSGTGGIMQTMGSLPPLEGAGGAVIRTFPNLARAVGLGAGVAVGRARAIARGAAALCVKHPQWCSTIGGVAAVGALMESGQLPIPKRRRGRGLTPRDLRSFRRVARLIRVFAPTVRRIPHRALHVRGTGITHA